MPDRPLTEKEARAELDYYSEFAARNELLVSSGRQMYDWTLKTLADACDKHNIEKPLWLTSD